MKHFLISAAIFLLIRCFVCVNGAAVRRRVRDLSAAAEALEDMTRKAARDFEKRWRNERGSISVSVHECELERVDEAVCDLISAAEAGDAAAYEKARRRLMTALAELAEGENADLYGLF